MPPHVLSISLLFAIHSTAAQYGQHCIERTHQYVIMYWTVFVYGCLVTKWRST